MGLETRKPSYQARKLDGGIVTLIPAHELKDHQSPDAQNFDTTIRGMLQKRSGFIKFTAAAKVSPTGTFVSGLFAAALSSGTAYVLASEGTVLHDITAGNWSTTISGVTITVDTMVRMAIYNDKFFICNQGGGPYKWTGSGAAALVGGAPPANARNIMVHRSRVWMAQNTSVATFSALNSEEDYTTADNAGSISINKGDGMVINGMISGGDFAVISKVSPASGGKEGKLYVVFGSSPFDFSIRKVADVGATGQEGMVAYDNFVAIATDRGIFGIQGRNVFRLDRNIRPTYDAITNKGTIAAGRWKNTLRFAYPSSGTVNNQVFPVNVEDGVWGKDTGKNAKIYANHPDGRLLFGTSSTSILVWEDENGTNDDGAAINFYWETPDFSFEAGASPKRLHTTHLHAKNTGSYNVTVERYTDGTAGSENQTMNVSTEGPVKRFTHKANRGKFHRIRLTNNASGQAITIYGVTVFGQLFEPGSK